MSYKPLVLKPSEGGTGAVNTATSGKILIGDGTNFIASTPTYPNAAGTSGNVLTSDGTNWVSSPAAGGSTTYFQAYLTSTTNYATGSTTNVVIFDTAISNVGSAYDTATGIFTAPATGFYAFAATLFFVTGVGTTQFLSAYTGSVQSLRVSQLAVASAITSFSWAMPMTSGDTVKIQPYADGTGDFQLNGAALNSAAFTSASTFSGWRIA